MSRIPRILPLVGVAIAGVVAINALEGGPGMLGAMKSFAEDVGAASPAAPVAATASAAAKPPAAVCAPTAAELAKEAGLSPAELQVLQSLSSRRGQLDAREGDLDTQVQLIAAAEAKLDQRIALMNGLKGDIQGLLNQADQQAQTETDRLVRVYEAMKPKDAAARMTLMDDSVRLPMAAKMKERALAAILAQMPPDDAKTVTEKLAARVSGSKSLADARNALNPQAASAPTAQNPDPAKTASDSSSSGKSPSQTQTADNAPSNVAAAPAKPKAPRPARTARRRRTTPAPGADAAASAPSADPSPEAKAG